MTTQLLILLPALALFVALAIAPCFKNHESCREETHDNGPREDHKP